MQDVLENVFAQRETQIDPWRKQWLSVENYGLVRAAEDMMCDLQIGAIFYSRLWKKNFAVEIIPKEEQGRKNIRKPVGWHLKICKQCTANVEMKAYCDPCTTTVFISDDRQSERVTTTAPILPTIVKYFEENISR